MSAIRWSEDHSAVTSALVHASHAVHALRPDSKNDHFGNEYVSLDAMTVAAKAVLKEHHVTIMFTTRVNYFGDDKRMDPWVIITCVAVSDNGQFIEVDAPLPVSKLDAQGAASAITYGRRYALASLLALTTDEDDDGSVASGLNKAISRVAKPSALEQAHAAVSAMKGANTSVPTARASTGGTTLLPKCPVCEGPMWDNREKKANPRAPDFKCKKGCEKGVIWPGQWPPKEEAGMPSSPLVGQPLRGMTPEEAIDMDERDNEDDLPF